MRSLKGKPKPKARPLARVPGPVPTADAADVPAVPVAPPLVRGPRLPHATPGDRVVDTCGIGGFARISEVTQHGRIVGFGMWCGRHCNATDKPGTSCKKQVRLGEGETPMSHREAQLRLKRWFVAGHMQEGLWPEGKKRAEHLNFGGKGLALLASDAPGWSDMTELELNEACSIVPMHA